MKSSDILESVLQLAERHALGFGETLFQQLKAQYEFETLVTEELRK